MAGVIETIKDAPTPVKVILAGAVVGVAAIALIARNKGSGSTPLTTGPESSGGASGTSGSTSNGSNGPLTITPMGLPPRSVNGGGGDTLPLTGGSPPLRSINAITATGSATSATGGGNASRMPAIAHPLVSAAASEQGHRISARMIREPGPHIAASTARVTLPERWAGVRAPARVSTAHEQAAASHPMNSAARHVGRNPF